MNRLAVTVCAAVAGAAPAVAGWALAGPAGLLAAGVVATAAALLVLLVVHVPPRPEPPMPGQRPVPFPYRPYTRYRELVGALSWGRVSARHFDHVTRPALESITAALLTDRRGIDAAADRQAARRVLGDDLWALADPGLPRSDDSTAPPPPLEDVARLVRRLEEL